jgi:nitric oxide reductase large subunit
MVRNRTKLKYMEGDYTCKSFPHREFLSSYDFKTNMMFIIFLVYLLSIIKLFIFVIDTIADT